MKVAERRGYWEGHISACRASGLSAAVYCRDANLKVAQFYKWRRRLRPRTALIPVEVVASAAPVRIVVGEVEIVVEADSSPDALRIALDALA